MRRIRRVCALALTISAITVTSTVAQDGEWSQFRGPAGQGKANNAALPIQFGEAQNVAWKTAIPGEGHSSPVITADQIWLTSAIQSKLSPAEEKERLAKLKYPNGLQLAGSLSIRAICIDANSGQILHNAELFVIDEPEPKHGLNSYASPTPVIADGRVYCHFGTYGTAAVATAAGEIVWKSSDIHCDHQNGPGSSPIVWKNLLLIHFDGIDQQLIAAFHTADGSLAWQQKRTGKMSDTPEFQKAYCTPTIIERNGRQPQLISPAANWVYSVNPANGEELWRTHYGQLGFSTVPRPVFGNGRVFICTSYIKSRLLAIRFDGQGDVTKTHVDWTSDSQVPQKPSLLFVDDKLFMIADNGVATCLDATTGKRHWRERLDGNYSASPLFANGHIYFFSQNGKVTVIKADKEFETVAENTLDSGFMASPAVVGDAAILRTETHLYRIESGVQFKKNANAAAGS